MFVLVGLAILLSIDNFSAEIPNNEADRTVISGYKNYTWFETGNINILISVPHNGALKPADIPDRNDTSLLSDMNTRRLADVLRSELQRLFLEEKNQIAVPFLVANHLHRIKMDPNRDPTLSCITQKDDCVRAYNDYHWFISNNFKRQFLESSTQRDGKARSDTSGFVFSRALVLDIHGQTHAEDWIELGYILSREQLNTPTLDPAAMNSSIHNLIRHTSYGMEELIRGGRSLGGLLNLYFGYKCVPSPQHKGPQNGNYFNGGYITRAQGSYDDSNSPLNAIQIESPSSLRQDATVDQYAKNLAFTVYQYYHLNSFNSVKPVF